MSSIKDHIEIDGAVLCGAVVGLIKYKSLDDWYRDYMMCHEHVCPYCLARIVNSILDDMGYEKIKDMELY